MRKIISSIALLGIVGIQSANAVLTLGVTDIKNYTDKGYTLSSNYTNYNSCLSDRYKNNKTYTNFKRSECFKDNEGYKYFICSLTSSCTIQPNYSSQTTTANSNGTVLIQDKLDKFLSQVRSMRTNMEDEKYKQFLDTIFGKINTLGMKYQNNPGISSTISYLKKGIDGLKKEITTTNDLVIGELESSLTSEVNTTNNNNNDSYSQTQTNNINTNTTLSVNNTQTSSKIITNINTCEFDECLENNFYVIKSTNTQYPDGCKTTGLKDAGSLCILKIGDTYVAPKIYTTIVTKGNTSSSSYTGNGGDTITVNQIKAYRKFVPQIGIIENAVSKSNFTLYDVKDFGTACSSALQAIDQKYGRFTPSWDESKSNNFFSERNNVRNNSTECKTYDRGDSNLKDLESQGKRIIPLSDTIAPCSSILSKLIPSKKWETVNNLGGDGKDNICNKDSSNKTGLCLIDNNRSKLNLFTDKPYYSSTYSAGDSYPLDEYSGANFKGTYLGDWKALSPEAIYEKKLNYSATMIPGPDGSLTRPTINGKLQSYSFPEGNNGMYEICVGQ